MPGPSQAWVYLYKHSAGTAIKTDREDGRSFRLTASPNPFRASIRFQISGAAYKVTSLKAYDLMGREAADLSKNLKAGNEFTWKPAGLCAGIYVVKAGARDKFCSKILLYQP